MDKLVRKIEIPLARKAIEKAGLYIVGEKDAQGKGIASKLMRPMLRFCDDERMVAYLETNKETNVGLYKHYGFDLMREELIPKTPVTHYSMVRKPIGDK